MLKYWHCKRHKWRAADAKPVATRSETGPSCGSICGGRRERAVRQSASAALEDLMARLPGAMQAIRVDQFPR
jgi:hypothetical protein